ncbi:MAG: diguanylate cyclase (GGDEF)-like protein/PAS domain S-box-containing protein [Sulfurimonas sp.]|jgi:diguanylate cyclase (GGDEF)-like protein/PAS domain S-box-containing protein
MSFDLDIDLIPSNVAIYKKVGDDFIFVAFNKAAQITEKISSDKVIGKKLTEVFPKVKEFGLFEVLLRVHESGKSEVYATTFYEDKRVSGWRQNNIQKLANENLIVFYSEIEQLVERQKEVFQHIMEKSELISVQGYNENHEVVYWNKASENLYFYSAKEAKGKKLEELIIPEPIVDIIYEGIENWIHKGIAIPSGEITLKDKYSNDVNVYSQHVMIQVDSSNQEMYCIDIDLKEVKHLQKELSMQKHLLRTIFDVIPDLIWLKDINGFYLYCNSKFEQFFGIKEADIIGSLTSDFVDPDLANFILKHDLKTLETNAPRRNEEYLVSGDGSQKVMFEATRVPMYDDENNIIGILGIAHDINERKKHEEELKIHASHDSLTGLANRSLFVDRLTQLLKQRKTKTDVHAILFIDLDHFKIINDENGHSIGDKVLIEVSHRLKRLTRRGDTVARFGGDEFTVLLEHIHDREEAVKVAQKILDALRKQIIIDEDKYYVTSSIGISLSPDDSKDSEVLIHYADIAMYKAKSSGKDTYKFFVKD